jgi:LEA14-like dessication related protein/protocatechuate 3,4-dioxygenase beta subunit
VKKVKAVGIGIGVFVLIIAIIGVLFYYSYTQIHVSLNDVSYHSIDWTDVTLSTLLKIGLKTLTGNWLSAAFDLIDGVNLNLFFALSNYGFLPVYIPDLSYDLIVNEVSMGEGKVPIDITIYPGETKEVKALQNFKKASLTPAISSIVSNGGMIDLHVKGTAYFKLLGLEIPIPFESSKQVSLYDEIKNKLLGETSKNQKEQTLITLNIPSNSIYEENTLYISGRLTTSDGSALQNAIVYIKDEDTGSGDDTIKLLSTDSYGNFGFTWFAKSMDPFDDTVEFYAVFDGASTYDSARSYPYDVTVISQPSKSLEQYIIPTVPQSSQNTFKSTSISLNIPYTTVSKGDIIPILGKLVDSGGKGVSNALIYVKDEDSLNQDDLLGNISTDSNGLFTFNWNAEKRDPFDNIVEIYAVFEGSTNFDSSRSIQIDVRVN